MRRPEILGVIARINSLRVVVSLEIHAFQDGNGRLSRVLTTLLLLLAGNACVPYSSLESVIEQNRGACYLALRQTLETIRSDAPNWQPWLVFFLRSLQVRRLNEKVEREKLALAPLPELSPQIVELARGHGRVRMGDVMRLTGAGRNTLKQHFRRWSHRATSPGMAVAGGVDASASSLRFLCAPSRARRSSRPRA